MTANTPSAEPQPHGEQNSKSSDDAPGRRDAVSGPAAARAHSGMTFDTPRLVCLACGATAHAGGHAAGWSTRCPGCQAEMIVTADYDRAWDGRVAPIVCSEEEAARERASLVRNARRRRRRRLTWIAATILVGGLLWTWWGGWQRSVDAIVLRTLPRDTDAITSLTGTQAEALVRDRFRPGMELSLNGLQTLPMGVARALTRHSGELSLDGLTWLPPDVAQVLAWHDGGLSLDGLRTLLPGTALALGAQWREGLSLGGLTSLSPETVGLLAHHQYLTEPRGTTALDAITELSEEAAGCLAQHAGTVLALNGLTTLSDRVAARLSVFRGVLHLDGLADLSPAAAASLSWLSGASLSLNGLAEISDGAAAALADYPGSLHLDGIVSLSAEQARFLRKKNTPPSLRRWRTETVPNLTAVTVEQADLLVGDESFADALSLGIQSLTPEVAKALAKYRGQLQLDGLTEIPLDAEIALASHRSRSGSSDLSCRGLTSLKSAALANALARGSQSQLLRLDKFSEITPEAAAVLVDSGCDLDLTSLGRLEPELARVLARSERGELRLDGVTHLSVDAARAFARHDGAAARGVPNSLSLDGLAALAPEAAEALAGYSRGFLSFDGIGDISADVARALAKHAGPLRLRGLASLTADAAAELARHEGLLWLGVKTLPEEAAQSLALHRGGILLGVASLSDESAVALAATADRLFLTSRTNATPAAFAALHANPRFRMPLEMYSPLEQFLWGLKGWPKLLLVASLLAMAGGVALSFHLSRRLSKVQDLTLATKRQAKTAAMPLIIATSLFAGWSGFLGLKVLPHWLMFYDALALEFPGGLAPLDIFLLGLLTAVLATLAYWLYVVTRLEQIPPLWIMTRHPSPPGTRVVRTADILTVIGVAVLGWGLMWLIGEVTARPPDLFMRLVSMECLLAGCVGLVGICLLIEASKSKHRQGVICEAYSDHFRGKIRPVATEKVWVIGHSVIPLSAVTSYSWKSDHLELTVRPGRPHNKIAEQWLISGVVPPEQREATRAFLSERLPGKSTPSAS